MEKVHIKKQMLSSAVKHELVFIKFDGVTRLRSHYLGINIQYFDKENGNTTVKCLELINTDAKHDSLHMKNLIIKTLTKFNISKLNVLGVVDNASNMTKTIQLLNQDEDYSKEELDNDGTFQEATMNDTVLRNVIVNSFDVTVYHMHCGEHTLQLGIKDALKLDGLGQFLTKIRDIAGHLRAPQTDATLKHHNKSMIMDVATRWGSTVAMLKRLFELRECFLAWHEAIFELHKKMWLQHILSPKILKSVFNLLSKTKVFLAAVWMDSRFQILLNSDQKEAKLKLFSVYK